MLELALEKLGPDPAGDGQADGRLVGFGVACCVESTGFGRGEPAKIHLSRDGVAHVYVGSTPQGQGHETMVALVIADRLGWPFDKIHVTAGDTQHVPFALLTAGSRSAVQVGNAAAQAATAMRKRVLERAGDVLEADVVDLLLEDGVIGVLGSPARRVPATDVLPDEGLEVFELRSKRPLAFSSGCHAAVVAVDPETGQVEVLKYVIAHDTGKAINPVTLEGQAPRRLRARPRLRAVRGGHVRHGWLVLTASFLDYTIVSTGEMAVTPQLVSFDTATDANPEGFKGAGERDDPRPRRHLKCSRDALRKRNPICRSSIACRSRPTGSSSC